MPLFSHEEAGQAAGLSPEACAAADAQWQARYAEVQASCVKLYNPNQRLGPISPTTTREVNGCIIDCASWSYPMSAQECVTRHWEMQAANRQAAQERFNLDVSLAVMAAILGTLIWLAVRAARR